MMPPPKPTTSPDVLRSRLEARLARQRKQDLWRERLSMSPNPRAPLRDFASNDYLGLARDPRVAEALAAGARREGAGAGASHLVNGHFPVHQALEERLAELTGRPRALLFSTGYMANLGVLQTLCDGETRVFQDRLNHASLLDGARLAQSPSRRFHHRDLNDLERLLRRAPREPAKLVVSDGVFSMDGDTADVEGLAATCQRQGAWLMIDDAHGIGVLGEQGDGLVGQRFSTQQVPVLVGTLGKAFGSCGAFVAGDDVLIDALTQFARPYIYTTAQPPGMAHATLRALDISEQEPERRERLHAHIQHFRQAAEALGLPLMDSATPIQPILLGDNQRVMRWSLGLREAGFMVGAIRHPTVPRGTARLRVVLNALHESDDIKALLDVLAELKFREAKAS